MKFNPAFSAISVLVVGCLIHINVSAKEANEFANSEATLTIIGDPADFAVSLYGRVLATQYMRGDNTDDKINIASHYFSQKLYNVFNQIYKNDAQNQDELGCLDFDPFTGTQEVKRGFLVDNSEQNTPLKVAVRLTTDTLKGLEKPKLYLQLIKSDNGFRVDNIDYGKEIGNLRDLLQTCLKKRNAN